MKFYIIAAVIAFSLSSCLKESIPDAMLASKNKGSQGSTATLSYEVNGNAVNISVNDANNWNGSWHTLDWGKNSGYYALNALSSSGEFVFAVYTDSLTTGNYKYGSNWGDRYFITYNGQVEYVHAPSDSMSLNITSYNNGRISGNFSGVLTPLNISNTTNNDEYGTPSSVHITSGSFKNVPVIY